MELITIERAGGPLDDSAYESLERGNILFFPKAPFGWSEEDYRFLTAQRQTGAGYHKNIAYRPADSRLTGVAAGTDRETLRRILKTLSEQSERILARLLPRYAAGWRLDYASFRPFEEENRGLSLHARNDLLHFDAFPTRPTHGDRIMRFFVNLNPEQSRVWITGESFETLAARFAGNAGLPGMVKRPASPLTTVLVRLAAGAGFGQFARSPYDSMMHRLHNFLKENTKFQAESVKDTWEFPPLSSWIVYTDIVSHAVLSGRLAFEQTFIIARQSMLRPEFAPASVLERIVGAPVTGGPF